jgi:hypothetical protein
VTWIEPAADLERKLEGAILIGEQTREALLSDFNLRERAQLVALRGRIKTNLALLDGL